MHVFRLPGFLPGFPQGGSFRLGSITSEVPSLSLFAADLPNVAKSMTEGSFCSSSSEYNFLLFTKLLNRNPALLADEGTAPADYGAGFLVSYHGFKFLHFFTANRTLHNYFPLFVRSLMFQKIQITDKAKIARIPLITSIISTISPTFKYHFTVLAKRKR